MARKKKHPEHVNHERWLVSYADFMTLLFAFFVVMFAVSQVDGKKVGRFTQSFSQAMGVEVFPGGGQGLLAGEAPAREGVNGEKNPGGPAEDGKSEGDAPDLAGLREALRLAAKKDPQLAALQVIERRDELVLRLSEAIMFDSGAHVMKEAAKKVLDTVSALIRPMNVEVRIEGHTDNVPVRQSVWPSNWELSTARSVAVLHVLASSGIAPDRLSAAGYGEFHPIASNDNADGRSRNRRVDLVVLPLAFKVVKP
jgi:chemotaxis protein MotB